MWQPCQDIIFTPKKSSQALPVLVTQDRLVWFSGEKKRLLLGKDQMSIFLHLALEWKVEFFGFGGREAES